VPPDARTPPVARAIEAGVEYLLGVDPATAGYPAGWGGRVSSSWFKPGFPSGFVADVIQVAEAVADAGSARDPRLAGTVDWILERHDDAGRWRNQYAYHGKLWQDIDPPRAPSKWVTLRACRVLRAALGD
jgi:hypothetical protein